LDKSVGKYLGFFISPVQAGFVTKEEDWKYSSARDFCGMKGLVSLSYS
jgi:hypothetical protein